MDSLKIKIYYTSDLHGHFFPTDYTDRKEKNTGLLKCASQFEKDGNTLVIDGGDLLQGSPFAQYCCREQGSFELMAELMNQCGYDFVTLGNHDFNFGPEKLNTYLNALNAQCICQNLSSDIGEPLFPYTIRTMANGLRVGIVGLVTDFIAVWEKPENLLGIHVEDTFSAARKALAELADKTDLTIGVYHGGFERDLDTGRQLSKSSEHIACRICEELAFDILLTGHQHVTIPGRNCHGTYIIQPPVNGQGFACLEVCLECRQEERLLTVSSALADACGSAALLTEAWVRVDHEVQNWLDEPAGVLPAPLPVLDRVKMAVNGSALADFFNLIQTDCSGACLSATSFANDVAPLPVHVRRRDLFLVYPYPNTFVVLEITGKILRAAIERSAEYLEYQPSGTLAIAEDFLKPKAEHYNYDFYSGVETQIDYRRPRGNRVTGLTYHGAAVTDEDLFTICLNNYRATGAGGYQMYVGCPVLKTINREMTDLLFDYFGKSGK